MHPKYVIYLNKNKFNDAKIWCERTYGARWIATDRSTDNNLWCVFWNGFDPEHPGTDYRFHFFNEEDKINFALRWL